MIEATLPRVRVALALPALLCPAGCGAGGDEPLLQSTDGRFRVVYQGEGRWLQDEGRREMESALARIPHIDVVYAHNDPMARGAQLAAQQAGRSEMLFIGIDALPHEGRVYVEEGKLDATFEYPTGGAEAVDLAILAVAGVALPKDIVLGTRAFTRENVASGGEPIPAPGDAAIERLRFEHEARLDAEGLPRDLRIGLSQCNIAEPWRKQMNEDVRARVLAFGGRVELVEKDAQNDANTQREQVEEFVAEGVDAILVSPKEEVVLVPAVDRALEQGIPVIVLDRRLGGDRYTCFLGGDNVAIGRAAGEFVRRHLGDQGGTIVEIRGLWTSSPARERHRGFAEALGLR